ncbi:hypothetical protein KQX54_017740 [Cotesia glomerata]|uniref:Uncharacterized protein n=1 Tax=Cotesia glomerata TaxID=32391 RepID=A0AAV7HYH2_COTGL|nr:hypothetical protein KQX54_017740 [Cotesia glomerata]
MVKNDSIKSFRFSQRDIDPLLALTSGSETTPNTLFFYLASTWWPGARCTLRRSHAQKSLVTERYLFRPLKNSANEK